MNDPKKICEVCTQNQSKYKCPKCYVLYCSLNCFKSHKESSCLPVEKPIERAEEAEINSDVVIKSQTDHYNKDEIRMIVPNAEPNLKDIQSDFIPENKLKLLGQSDGLKNILSNKHLREFLVDLNSQGSDIDVKMEKAMQEPLFQEFADTCLKIVQNEKDLQNL